jgi:predicted ribonuclease YlaK
MSLGKLFKDELRIRLKANTEVLFENTDPLIDFSKHQLSREIQDDHLITSIIAFREQRPDTPVVLVASDTGLILKAKALTRHIESVVIPDDYKLPEEPDPLEKENRELKQKIRILENRIPDLKLCFANNSDYIVCTLPKPAILSSDEIEHRMKEIRRQHPKLSNPLSTLIMRFTRTIYLKQSLASFMSE